jgi:oxygen-independent coproporphyrinogen-3 oxidase
VKQCFSIAQNAEVTMEENPGTVERGSPVGYLDAGITRLSIGAQSFDDGALKLLGRIHSSADTLRAVLDAKEAGFDNINIDLMYGLPSQSVEMAMADLTAAIDLDVTHISWYQLTLEPNTIFYAHPPPNLPDDDLAFEIQEQGQELLRRFGYEQYEVSAYAREGRLCQHNLNYWSFGDYLAVGAGAHGKITVDSKICRYQKPANPMQYMIAQESNEPEEDLKPLSETDLMLEFMLNALRLNAGFTEKLFVARTGLMTTDLVDATVDVRKKGLIEYNDDQIWMPTKLGRRFLNDLQSSFITN